MFLLYWSRWVAPHSLSAVVSKSWPLLPCDHSEQMPHKFVRCLAVLLSSWNGSPNQKKQHFFFKFLSFIITASLCRILWKALRRILNSCTIVLWKYSRNVLHMELYTNIKVFPSVCVEIVYDVKTPWCTGCFLYCVVNVMSGDCMELYYCSFSDHSCAHPL